MINREINLQNYVRDGKVLIIYGPRRVGKTVLLQNYLKSSGLKYKLDTGDDIRIKQLFSSSRLDLILEYSKGYDLIAIDEAQQIKNIGVGLKLLVDAVSHLKVIVTGSSAFSISQNLGEPLTGRKRELFLYPFSQKELSAIYNPFELKSKLSEFLIYGSYPDIFLAKSKTDKKELLIELVNSYLLKDVFAIENIRGSKQLIDLLKLLAFQVGSQVSINELATQIGMDSKTIQRYIDVLEKAYVIKRLTPFSRNLRKEITSKNKYYFLDNGIRNGIIMQFNDINNRDDIGKLFENFLFAERLKRNSYERNYCYQYFWRTQDKKEIDLIEDKDGVLNAFEFKWNANKKYTPPKEFLESYSNSTFSLVNQDNYESFLKENVDI